MVDPSSTNSLWIPPLSASWIEGGEKTECTVFVDHENIEQATASIFYQGIRSFWPVEWTFPLISKERIRQLLLKQQHQPCFEIQVERQGKLFKVYLHCQKLFRKAEKIIRKLSLEIFTANPARLSLHPTLSSFEK